MTIEEYNYKMDRDNKVHSSITVIFCLFTVTYTHILFLACLTVNFCLFTVNYTHILFLACLTVKYDLYFYIQYLSDAYYFWMTQIL